MIKNEKVELVPYTPNWKKYFEKECVGLKSILKNNLIQIHHIGSTAITSIKAIPTLDILVEVHTLDGIEFFLNEFKKKGLTKEEVLFNEEKLEFIRLAPNGTSILSRISIYDKNSKSIDDYLDFRDYLCAEPEVAKKYEKLKMQLNSGTNDSRTLYRAGKREFIEIVLKNIT